MIDGDYRSAIMHEITWLAVLPYPVVYHRSELAKISRDTVPELQFFFLLWWSWMVLGCIFSGLLCSSGYKEQEQTICGLKKNFGISSLSSIAWLRNMRRSGMAAGFWFPWSPGLVQMAMRRYSSEAYPNVVQKQLSSPIAAVGWKIWGRWLKKRSRYRNELLSCSWSPEHALALPALLGALATGLGDEEQGCCS